MEMTHKHDCDECKPIGSLHLPGHGAVDFYRCSQHGIPTTIGRHGDGADYLTVPDVLIRETYKGVANFGGEPMLLLIAAIGMICNEAENK
jgi:hypothetical protein